MPSKTWTIMAAGVPIIASFDIPSEMKRTIESAECGYCVNSGDVKALAGTIEKISKNSMETARMAKNARIYAEKCVSKDTAIAAYIAAISKIIV